MSRRPPHEFGCRSSRSFRDGEPWEFASVQASQDLKAWEEIARVGKLTGSFVVIDSASTGQPCRFWRAVEVES